MDRAALKSGFITTTDAQGQIAGFDEWIKAVKRWAFSNPNRKIMLLAPKRVTKTRSNQQCRAVMGLWMDLILEELGYEPDDKAYIYDKIKISMGWTVQRTDKKTGNTVWVPMHTKNLDTMEYCIFMEKFARHVAIEHGITLPDPEHALAVI